MIEALGKDQDGNSLAAYLPKFIPLLERPWLNLLSPQGMSKPFNVTRWIEDSVRVALNQALQKERAATRNQRAPLQQQQNTLPTAHNVSAMLQLERISDAILQSWYSWAEVIQVPRYFFSLVRAWTSSPPAIPEATPSLPPSIPAPSIPQQVSNFWKIPHSIDLTKYGIYLVVELGLPKDP